MRHTILLALLLALLGAVVPVRAALSLEITVGFDGFYRPRTLTPIAVHIKNDGPQVRGVLHIASDEFLPDTDRYSYEVTIPRQADQRRFIYFLPTGFAREIRVDFLSQGRRLARAKYTRCQEIYDQDRLMAVIGGTGSSFSALSGASIMVPGMPKLRPWDYGALDYYQQQMGGGRTAGSIRIAYLSPEVLPDNPECYGSIDILALMATVTENRLSADAQRCIPVWVANGGHLIIGGGGVAARLQSPFFTRLTAPRHTAAGRTVNLPGVGEAHVQPFARGYVTRLTFDPDATVVANWRAAAKFYTNLLAREPKRPATFDLRATLANAVMVRNLKPPNLSFIVIYLLVYLILLVPVNYFVLRKLDRRELAWITIPAIVLLFTVGAYGVGYATKGRQLVLNVASVTETVAGQRFAQAVSSVLIFSPSRSSYRMRLGEYGLMARDARNTPYENQPYRLSLVRGGDELTVDDVRINMWDFRTFATVHAVDLGQGVSAKLKVEASGVTGTLTNGSSFAFPFCRLYKDGELLSTFALNSRQTVTLAPNPGATVTPSFSADERHIFEKLVGGSSGRYSSLESLMHSSGSSLMDGVVFVGFTPGRLAPVHLDHDATTTNMAMVIVHL